MNPLSEWQNFFVIVGSAAGGLTGLQFVTMALIAEMPLSPEELEGNSVFSTPTIVYFSSVLVLAAVMVAPWHSGRAAALCWGAMGVGGLVYSGMGAWRLGSQRAYKPVLEDWVFRLVIPCLAYGMLAVATVVAWAQLRAAMFMVAAVVLVLLLNGIHNAWDNVTYIVMLKRQRKA